MTFSLSLYVRDGEELMIWATGVIGVPYFAEMASVYKKRLTSKGSYEGFL
jgi:hypothetical protein